MCLRFAQSTMGCCVADWNANDGAVSNGGVVAPEIPGPQSAHQRAAALGGAGRIAQRRPHVPLLREAF